MTYIIISIFDIEKQLVKYQQAIKEAAKLQDRDQFIKFTGKYYGLQYARDIGKQISLTEEDDTQFPDNKLLDEASDYIHHKYPNLKGGESAAMIETYYLGYKQALKDLKL